MPNDSVNLQGLPFMSHLLEMRDRLMRMVIAVLVLLIILFPFGNDIYSFVAAPLMDVLPEGTTMIATQVASPFLTPFKLAMVASIFLAMPYLLYQFWGFIAPGLYDREKRLAFPMLASSILLFYSGAAFAYFVVFPLVFAFLTSVAPEGVAVMTDISHYLDFVLTLFFAFGLSFEVPIATILLVQMKMTTPQKLAEKRPFIIVGAFVLGMFLTPPDIISQTLLAVPIWLLFELGVFLSRLILKERENNKSIKPIDDEEPSASSDSNEADGEVLDDEYQPLSDEEMDAELDALDDDDEMDGADEAPEASAPTAPTAEPFVADAVDAKLERVMTLREQGDIQSARGILYEVMGEGNETQKKVARNILDQLDS